MTDRRYGVDNKQIDLTFIENDKDRGKGGGIVSECGG
jgi:hypothetical protein